MIFSRLTLILSSFFFYHLYQLALQINLKISFFFPSLLPFEDVKALGSCRQSSFEAHGIVPVLEEEIKGKHSLVFLTDVAHRKAGMKLPTDL